MSLLLQASFTSDRVRWPLVLVTIQTLTISVPKMQRPAMFSFWGNWKKIPTWKKNYILKNLLKVCGNSNEPSYCSLQLLSNFFRFAYICEWDTLKQSFYKYWKFEHNIHQFHQKLRSVCLFVSWNCLYFLVDTGQLEQPPWHILTKLIQTSWMIWSGIFFKWLPKSKMAPTVFYIYFKF